MNKQTKKTKTKKGKSTHLGLRHPSHLATPHVLSVLIVSPKDLSPEINHEYSYWKVTPATAKILLSCYSYCASFASEIY